MRRGRISDFVLAWAVLGMAVVVDNFARGQSFSSPIPIGVTTATTVDDTDIFDPSPPCDVKITVLEIVRANEAWELIREASTSNKPPEPDFEYVIARVRFEYHARNGTPRGKTYELRRDELIAASANGKWYEIPALVLPKPGLKPKLVSEESSEGSIVFMVRREDKKPLMFFQRGGIWFQLYK